MEYPFQTVPDTFSETGGLVITKKVDLKKYEIPAWDPVRKRKIWLKKIVSRKIKAPLLKSCGLPYVVRAILDHYQGEPLTFLQQKMIQPLLTGSS